VYDRTRALYGGDIPVEGVDLRYLQTGIEELFWRQGRYAEFDAAEFSFGAYIAGVEQADGPFCAIPVFPSRSFRHSAFYVPADSDVQKPEDLSGRSIGTPEWSMTASLWMRGLLGEFYGLDLESVLWRTGGLQDPGRQEKSRVVPPSRFKVESLDPTETLIEQLVHGGIDALISARPPTLFLEGDPRIRRVFPHYRSEERSFFQRTGILPLMHVVVLKKTLVEEHPWVANNLRSAFEAARAQAAPALLDSAVCRSSLVWESAYAEEESAIFGDAFAYGVDANRVTLTTLLRYAHEQGFTSRPLDPEDLFVPSTLTEAKV
ncbi:MAG: 4,5-dihydroxyphthalate decarboxylase, partial [Actinomycetes bacterium]